MRRRLFEDEITPGGKPQCRAPLDRAPLGQAPLIIQPWAPRIQSRPRLLASLAAPHLVQRFGGIKALPRHWPRRQYLENHGSRRPEEHACGIDRSAGDRGDALALVQRGHPDARAAVNVARLSCQHRASDAPAGRGDPRRAPRHGGARTPRATVVRAVASASQRRSGRCALSCRPLRR